MFQFSLTMSCNLDPTLTLPNLTTLLERVDWNHVGQWTDIPKATLDMIRTSGGDDSQRRQKCWEVYLSEHPSPSWKQVADALYIRSSSLVPTEYLKELEVVQKKYLKGGCAVIITYLSMCMCMKNL